SARKRLEVDEQEQERERRRRADHPTAARPETEVAVGAHAMRARPRFAVTAKVAPRLARKFVSLGSGGRRCKACTRRSTPFHAVPRRRWSIRSRSLFLTKASLRPLETDQGKVRRNLVGIGAIGDRLQPSGRMALLPTDSESHLAGQHPEKNRRERC